MVVRVRGIVGIFLLKKRGERLKNWNASCRRSVIFQNASPFAEDRFYLIMCCPYMQGENSDKILLMLWRIGMHNQTPKENVQIYAEMATLNQHPSTHHPLDGCPLLLTCGWMNLNSDNIWFHLGNQFCKK
jgi:hypothetical protein